MYSEHKVLAITSLPTIGNAGLKNMISILTTRIIAIPTTVACGLGNMTGHQKIQLNFDLMLSSTLEIAKNNGCKLIVYTGYFTETSQIDTVIRLAKKYASIIEYIIVDPVCGDHAKAYVSSEIIEKLRELITIANLIVPNQTELQLLLGQTHLPLAVAVENFKALYPDIVGLVTSCQDTSGTYNYLISKTQCKKIGFQALPAAYSGTGDLFSALLIHYFFYKGQSLENAIDTTATRITKLIKRNQDISTSAFDFCIDTQLLSNYE